MKISLTGASSFTGCHIAKALVAAGHEVQAFFTRSSESYIGDLLIQRRVKFSNLSNSMCVYDAPFGSPVFLESLDHFKPDVFINHGADIKGYRSPDFNVEASVARSLFNHEEVIEKLFHVGCKGFVHSGTVFEPIDGMPAFSPYGNSKFLVSSALEKACGSKKLAFSKIFIANPIGNFENEDRLIPIFVKQWISKQQPFLSAPRVVWDHVPAPWLARVYLEEAEQVYQTQKGHVRRPSGFQVDLESFVDMFCSEARKLGLHLDFGVGENQNAPIPRLNNEPCVELDRPTEKALFFKDWISTLFGLDVIS